MHMKPPAQAKKKLTVISDRRQLRDRRRRNLPIAFADRRQACRRRTELQAFIWNTLGSA